MFLDTITKEVSHAHIIIFLLLKIYCKFSTSIFISIKMSNNLLRKRAEYDTIYICVDFYKN